MLAATLLLAAAASAAAGYLYRRAAALDRELEAARAAVSHEKIKIETLLQNITDGLVLTNLRGEVLFINTEAMEILGAQPHEVAAVNKGLFEMVDKDQYRLKVQRILKTHTHSEVTEMQVLGESGSQTRYYRTSVRMFTDPKEGNFGVALLMRDVTAEKNLDALKDEFFRTIAHDLRAPLLAIQGYLRILERSMTPDKQQKSHIEAIHGSCEKLTLFIQDILDSSQIESGSLKPSLSRFEPRTLLERVVKIFHPLASEKGIQIQVSLPTGDPAVLEADERLLERVFYNLLSNAVKFTPAGGRIAIDMTRAGPDQIEFSVSDTGPGVPDNMRTQIFEKHRQVQAELRGGFGLGLDICKKIVELHKGTIWVDANPPGGSQFIVRLPAAQEEKK